MDRGQRWRRAAADKDFKAQRTIIREFKQTCRDGDARPDVGFLCDALDDSDANVRRASLYALAEFAPDNPSLVIAVRDQVERSQYPVNLAALADFLCSAGEAADQAVPLLLEILKSLTDEPSMFGGEFLWESTLAAIGHVGPAARDAIPMIMWSLDAATDDRVPSAAADALVKIGIPSVRPMMDYIQHAQSSDFVRGEVTRALGNIRAAADEIVPFLIQQYTSCCANQCAAAFALFLLGPAAKAAIPHLMQHPLPYLDELRFQALWKIQGDAALVVPKFIENLEGDDPRCSVARTLGEIGPEARSAIPALQKQLLGSDRGMWVAAAVALWRIAAWEDALPVIAAADWLVRIGQSFSPYDDQIVQCANGIQFWPPQVETLRTFLDGRRAERLVTAKQLKQASPSIVPALVLIAENTPYRRNAVYRHIATQAREVLDAFGDEKTD